MDNREISLLLLLHFSKAFDSIHHRLLSEKLQLLGIGDSALEWFKSYLSGRSQVVRVKDILSTSQSIFSGVPQGSILGPLLFILYVNDLPSCITHAHTYQFADDTQLLYSFDPKSRFQPITIKEQVEEDLQSLQRWCHLNCLCLNAAKTKLLPIGHRRVLQRNSPPEITFDGHALSVVTSVRNLGVEFDNHLTFKPHITKVISTANGRLSNLAKLQKDFPQDVLKTTIETNIISPALYCLPVWSSCSKTDLAKLQRRILHWPAKIINGADKFDRVGTMLQDLDWMPLEQRVKHQNACLAIDAYHGILGDELEEIFAIPQHEYCTRSAVRGGFLLPKTTTDRGRNRFGYIGPSLLNEFCEYLPMSRPKFKNCVKKVISNV